MTVAKNKIMLINSYKGGCGKTTTSLILAVTAKHRSIYNRVYYYDLDVTGTGALYNIYGITKETNSSNLVSYKYPSFDDDYRHEVKLGNTTKELYAYIIDPQTRISNLFGEELNMDSGSTENKYVKAVFESINHNLEDAPTESKLIIVDCSPGYRSFENKLNEKLLDSCLKGFEIQMCFLASPTTTHVEKTFVGIKDIIENTSRVLSNVTIVINNNIVQPKDYEIVKKYVKNKLDELNKEVSPHTKVSLIHLPFNSDIQENSICSTGNHIHHDDGYKVYINMDSVYIELLSTQKEEKTD